MRGSVRSSGRQYVDPVSIQARREAAIRAMGLRAWYSNHVGSSSTKMVDISGNGVADATVGAGSNSPLWLPYTVPSVYLSGVASNYITTPHAASMNACANDFEIVVNCRLPAATGTEQTVASKGATAAFAINSAGALRVYSGGAAGSLAHGLTTGVRYWFRIQRAASTGTVTLSYSADQAEIPSAWTSIGTIANSSGASATNADPLSIGAAQFGTLPFSGEVSRVLLRDAVSGGTTVADFNAALCGQSGYTGSVGNVWTVNRATSGRKTVVQSPAANSAHGVWLFGTDDWIDVPAAAVPPLDSYAAPSSVMLIYRMHSYANTNAVFATKASLANAVLGFTIRPNASGTQHGAVAGDGTISENVFQNFPAAGSKLGAYASVGNTSPFLTFEGSAGSVSTDIARDTTVTTSTGLAGRIGAFTGGTGPADLELYAYVAADRELTVAERSQIRAFYGVGL